MWSVHILVGMVFIGHTLVSQINITLCIVFYTLIFLLIDYLFAYKILFEVPILHNGRYPILATAGKSQSPQCFLCFIEVKLSKFRMSPFLLLLLSVALTFWSWRVSWCGCGSRKAWDFQPSIIPLPLTAAAKIYLLVFGNWHSCPRLCHAPPGPWLHSLSYFLLWHLSLLILTFYRI